MRVGVVIRFRCFGAFQCTYQQPEEVERTIAIGRGRRLLQYLAAHADRPVQFDTLADALWPGLEFDSSVHRLHQLASAARATLREATGGAASIRHTHKSYAWSDLVRVESDVAQFVNEFKQGSGASFERALDFYRGPFMAGEHLDWIVAQRMVYASMYASILEHLIRDALEHGDYSTALSHALRIIDTDPANEDGARLIMECYARLGHVHSALTEYEILERHLRRSLNVRPTAETRAFRERILSTTKG